MRTKKWLQTAIVGFGGVERKIPFSYFFPDFDEMGPVVIFVNEKENGEIDVYKVYTESGFMIEETNVPSTYVVEIKTIRVCSEYRFFFFRVTRIISLKIKNPSPPEITRSIITMRT